MNGFVNACRLSILLAIFYLGTLSFAVVVIGYAHLNLPAHLLLLGGISVATFLIANGHLGSRKFTYLKYFAIVLGLGSIVYGLLLFASTIGSVAFMIFAVISLLFGRLTAMEYWPAASGLYLLLMNVVSIVLIGASGFLVNLTMEKALLLLVAGISVWSLDQITPKG